MSCKPQIVHVQFFFSFVFSCNSDVKELNATEEKFLIALASIKHNFSFCFFVFLNLGLLSWVMVFVTWSFRPRAKLFSFSDGESEER